MPPVTEMALVVGPIEPATKRGRFGGAGGVGSCARDRAGEAIDFARVFGEPILGQHDRGAAEGVGLDDIGAGVEETVVQFADFVGARADQVLVASFELRAAEVGRAEMHVLDGRPAAPSIMTIREASRSRKSPIRSEVLLMLKRRGPAASALQPIRAGRDGQFRVARCVSVLYLQPQLL